MTIFILLSSRFRIDARLQSGHMTVGRGAPSGCRLVTQPAFRMPSVIVGPHAVPRRVAGWVDPDTAGEVLRPVSKAAIQVKQATPDINYASSHLPCWPVAKPRLGIEPASSWLQVRHRNQWAKQPTIHYPAVFVCFIYGYVVFVISM